MKIKKNIILLVLGIQVGLSGIFSVSSCSKQILVDLAAKPWSYPISPISDIYKSYTTQEGEELLFDHLTTKNLVDDKGNKYSGKDIFANEIINIDNQLYNKQPEIFSSYIVGIDDIKINKGKKLISFKYSSNISTISSDTWKRVYTFKNLKYSAYGLADYTWFLEPVCISIYDDKYMSEGEEKAKEATIEYLKNEKDWSFTFEQNDVSKKFDYRNADELFDSSNSFFTEFKLYSQIGPIYYFSLLKWSNG